MLFYCLLFTLLVLGACSKETEQIAKSSKGLGKATEATKEPEANNPKEKDNVMIVKVDGKQ